MQSRSAPACRRARAGQGRALRSPQMRPALTAPARGGSKKRRPGRKNDLWRGRTKEWTCGVARFTKNRLSISSVVRMTPNSQSFVCAPLPSSDPWVGQDIASRRLSPGGQLAKPGLQCLGDVSQTGGGIMRALSIVIGAAAILFGVRDAALAQTSTTPNVTTPFTGLSTPLTSTTTTCMMTCNSQFALCQSSCVATRSVPPGFLVANPQLGAGNALSAGSCISFCTNQQLACSVVCARASPSR
jgi:hypothetical protein